MGRHETPADAYAQPIAADAIRIERVLPGPRERVWRYLTEPDLRRRWLAGGQFDLAQGGAVELEFHNNALTENDEPPPAEYAAHGGPSTLTGKVLACEPPAMLAFTWGEEPASSHVRFDLAEEGDKVRLTVTHSRVLKPGMATSVSAGWHTHLDLLVAALEDRKHEGFWRSFARIQPFYAARAARN
ncbi:ATPase [Alsobacter metallidurans]|uniref:ATPase n=1 Tax=Alsobacter metallidurans TaxID=340221 RepID=A0A917I3M8_9HYPH|nr:SRPBCC family protein [Alsobacter metallidurans]GGH10832.1 ATPase [Alsobacter metallidurans]